MEDLESLIDKVPLVPPDGMKSWLLGLPREEFIIYKAGYKTDYLTGEKEKVVECICTACGQMFTMPYVANYSYCARYGGPSFGFHDENGDLVTSYSRCKCPVCNENVNAIHTSCINNHCMGTNYIISVHRVENSAAVIQWKVKYLVYKNGHTEYETEPDEAYLFGKKKCVRLCTWENECFGNRPRINRWVARKRCQDMVNAVSSNLIFPFDSRTLDGTAMENSKLDIYLKSYEKVYPISYLRLYQLHNNVENLVTSEMGRIISEKIYRYCPGNGYSSNYYGKVGSVRNIRGIDFKRNKPHEMMGLTKEEYRTAVNNKWSDRVIDYYKRLKPFGARYTDVGRYLEVTPERCDFEFTDFSDTKDSDGRAVSFENLDFHKTASYLAKQKDKYESDATDWQMLRDYWNILIQLNEDYNNAEIRYPQRLRRAHDQTATRLTYKKNKEKDEAFKQRYNKLSRFSYYDDVLEIHPARSPYEMQNEGKQLHHCVASYIDSHASGKTSIFFIRHRTSPTTPYFTLEFDFKTMTVMQNRGNRNCARTDEVVEFENKWVDFVKQVITEE